MKIRLKIRVLTYVFLGSRSTLLGDAVATRGKLLLLSPTLLQRIPWGGRLFGGQRRLEDECRHGPLAVSSAPHLFMKLFELLGQIYLLKNVIDGQHMRANPILLEALACGTVKHARVQAALGDTPWLTSWQDLMEAEANVCEGREGLDPCW